MLFQQHSLQQLSGQLPQSAGSQHPAIGGVLTPLTPSGMATPGGAATPSGVATPGALAGTPLFAIGPETLGGGPSPTQMPRHGTLTPPPPAPPVEPVVAPVAPVAEPPPSAPIPGVYKAGDAVEAQCGGWGDDWFPARVREVLPSGEVQVLWEGEDPSISNVTADLVRHRQPEPGPAPAPAEPAAVAPVVAPAALVPVVAPAAPVPVVNGTSGPFHLPEASAAEAMAENGKKRAREEATATATVEAATSDTAGQAELRFAPAPPPPILRFELGPQEDITEALANLRRRLEVELKDGRQMSISLFVSRPSGRPQADEASATWAPDGGFIRTAGTPAAGTSAAADPLFQAAAAATSLRQSAFQGVSPWKGSDQGHGQSWQTRNGQQQQPRNGQGQQQQYQGKGNQQGKGGGFQGGHGWQGTQKGGGSWKGGPGKK